MLPFAHFAAGMTGALTEKDRAITTYLIAGLIGILPDVDFIMEGALLSHRHLTHSIIPIAILTGFVTLLLMRNFFIGFISIASHTLLDLIDFGSVTITQWPLYRTDWYFGIYDWSFFTRFTPEHSQIILSTIIATTIIITILIIEWRRESGKDNKPIPN